jgi:hypothetical protein
MLAIGGILLIIVTFYGFLALRLGADAVAVLLIAGVASIGAQLFSNFAVYWKREGRPLQTGKENHAHPTNHPIAARDRGTTDLAL